MPQMDGGLYGQQMGFPKTQDNRSMEQVMGLGYLPYPSCLSGTSADRAAQQNHGAPQVTQVPEQLPVSAESRLSWQTDEHI